ncbi:MAG: 5-dehydro-4-deoxy-D-glucuronate isomerase [Rubrimonas sp.]
MLTVATRHAVDPVAARAMDTQALRDHFAITDLFAPGEIRLVYTHYDRMIVGGCAPMAGPQTLDHVPQTGTPGWLDRREAAIACIAGEGVVSAAGVDHALAAGDMVYLPMGSGPVTFAGHARFYILSAPAHAAFPARVVRKAEARAMDLGAPETANARTIRQYVHPEVMPSCQLVVGWTQLKPGSVWNTMPAHVHDRRMEVYLYLDLPEDARVLHLMGQPDRTRHIVLGSEQAALSPPWSIHSGCGTASYSFIWAMAGENVDYRDMDFVAMEALR